MKRYEAQIKLSVLLPDSKLAKLRKPEQLPLERAGLEFAIAHKSGRPQERKQSASMGREYFLAWVMHERMLSKRRHRSDRDAIRDFMDKHAITEDDIPLWTLEKMWIRYKAQIRAQACIQARIYTKHNFEYWNSFLNGGAV